MRHAFALCATLLLAGSLADGAVAQEGGRGAGGFLGSAVGVTAKAWVDDRYAVTADLGWRPRGGGSVVLQAAYLIHSAEAPRRLGLFRELSVGGRFWSYYGAGAGLSLGDRNRLGVRAPAGLAYAAAPRASWDAFLEVAPFLELVPDADWEATAFAGMRYYFDARPLPVTRPAAAP